MPEFRVLGPLEALVAGRPVPLGGGRQRAVLALLLINANQPVSRDRLITELWGESPPRTASNALQVCVSNLRKALGHETVATRPPGYLVRVAPGALDLAEFERLLEEGRERLAAGHPREASEALRRALAHWRGPPLADFAYEDFARAEIARLAELRLTALERRIDADLALGRHPELVPELEALVAEHPYRERFRAQLMLALYRSGRQAEALDAYQDARRALVDGLGIDPGSALQELERAILRHDPSLDLSQAGEPAPAATERRAVLAAALDDEGLQGVAALAAELARTPPRELILCQGVADPLALADAAARVDELAARLGGEVPVRTTVLTAATFGEDVLRLAGEQEVDLLLVEAPPAVLGSGRIEGEVAELLARATCDVGLLTSGAGPDDGSVVVPFGGAEHDWAAVETGAWLAAARGTALTLVGTQAVPESGRRDASRLLSRAALLVQRAVGVATRPVLVEAGEAGLAASAQGARIVVLGLSPRWRSEGLGPARLALVREAAAPTLLVRRGPRPGGLAPAESLTRFTWTIAAARPDRPRRGAAGGPSANALT